MTNHNALQPQNEIMIPERDKPAFEVTSLINQSMLDLVSAGAEGINLDTDSTVSAVAVPNVVLHNGQMPFMFEGQKVTLSGEMATDDGHSKLDARLGDPGNLKVTSRTSLTFTDQASGKKHAFGLSTFNDGGTECFEWTLDKTGDAVGQSPRLETEGPEFQMLSRFAEAARIAAEQLTAPDLAAVSSKVGRAALNAG